MRSLPWNTTNSSRKLYSDVTNTPINTAQYASVWPGVVDACTASISASFEKKPEKPGKPISASVPITRRPVRDRQVLAQPAHLADVLLVVHRDDHGAGRQEQQRLEERVRHQMEDAGRVRGRAERDGHVAELRERRVRDDALDVLLHDAEQAREERRDRADR